MASSTAYLIAVATYRRPTELKRLLDSLVPALDSEIVQVLVVDNDPDATAKSIVAEHPLRPIYESEPEPGIASARNRALRAFDERFTAIIFVDDDEWVDNSWFQQLIRYSERTSTDVVQGPVVTVLPSEVPDWIRTGQFFQRQIQPSGTTLKSAATNNVLLMRQAWVDAGCPRFDHAFSATGGSDFDFFWGIRKSGASIAYCAEAVVYEDVPASRMSWSWVRQRYTRNGIAILRSHRKHREPMGRFLGVRTAALILGVLKLAVDLARGRGLRAAPVEQIFKSLGVFSGLFGYRINEYAR